MRKRSDIMKDTARNPETLIEVLLDIREELMKNRGLYFLAMVPNLSDKVQRDLAERISKAILNEDRLDIERI